ncbi:MAG: peptidase M14 [Candidatus Solibacter usitatus]|nr:peptidase M14 [Candidatus Solibacter usitatus]
MRLFATLLFLSTALQAAPPEFWPGAQYDAAIPTHAKVLGYDAGARISSHTQIMRYMEALAAAAPTRMRIFEYAKTWEGRKLIYAAIGSEASIRRLPEIKSVMQRLADPRKTPQADAKKLMTGLPAVVWLGYGVHGNEISSPDAALMTAYHLLAARNDKIVQDVLANTVVLIDPLQNPDGRDRFVHNFDIAEGLVPDDSPLAAEHNEPWPGGRTNHYYFDMNRDWFALTQPETKGRIRSLLEWFPLIFVDLHEMGSESTYYFAPEADPFNPHLSKDIMESLNWVGKNNAKWFDQFGFSFFTREVYDNFYPGYGASWPCYYGGVAMTYEQASSRGLLMRRSDDTVFSFRDTVRQHFVASISTLETAARYRERLLDKFYGFRRNAIEEGTNEPVKEYVFPRTGNVTGVDRLASLLTEQGIEVKRSTAAITVNGKSLPAGSYVISLAQPAKRLIRVLLDPNVPMEEKFLQEQERRRARKLPDEIYDVTAWSLPLLHNVEMISASAATPGSFEMVKAGVMPKGRVTGPAQGVAYLAPWGNSGTARLAVGALRQGYRVWSTDKPFTQNAKTFPAGTVVIKSKENPDTLAAAIRTLAADNGVEVTSTDTTWVDDGVNFGSRHVYQLQKPAIAIAWDRPTSAGSAGHMRYVLERQYGIPVTVVRTQQLATANLNRFNAIILPDAGFGEGYNGVLGANGARRLREWTAAGGTLIAIGSAVSYLADPRVGVLAIAQENRVKAAADPPRKKDDTEPRVPGKLFVKQEDYDKAIQADSEQPDQVAGVLAKAKLDPEHWMSAGAGPHIYALMNGRAIFTPIKLDKGFNAAVFAGPDEVVASGYMWEENRKQLAYKPLIVVQREGRGQIIAFTADPNFRAFMDGMNVLFLNAVLRGPARSRQAP